MPLDLEVDPAEPVQELPDRETLLETYARDPLEGIYNTVSMFMPPWMAGGDANQMSLGDTVRSMVEFTPIVGDYLDLRQGVDPGNDMDPLERGLAIFAGLGFVGTGAHFGRQAYTGLRERYKQQVEEIYAQGDMAQAVVGMELPGVEEARRLATTEMSGSIYRDQEERLAFIHGLGAQRWRRVATAPTMEALTEALWAETGELKTDSDGNEYFVPEALVVAMQGSSGGFRWDDMGPGTGSRAAFTDFVLGVGRHIISLGGFTPESYQGAGTDLAELYDPIATATETWSSGMDKDLFEASLYGLSTFVQAMDMGLLAGRELKQTGALLSQGDLFNFGATTEDMAKAAKDSAVAQRQIAQLATMVGRYSAPDLQLDPTMAWSAFYETADGRIIGSRERHGQFLPTSRYVDVEGNQILDPDGLDDAMSRLDLATVIPEMIMSLLALFDGQAEVMVQQRHRDAGKRWYPKMKLLIKNIADRFALKRYQVAAAISAFSPRNKWDPDNINQAIMAAMDFHNKGVQLTQEQRLAVVNEIRVSAGYAPVTETGHLGMGNPRAKAATIFEGQSPVQVLRMLKTLAFMHNGLWPTADASTSPFGMSVITGDVHWYRALMGFFHGVEAPWFNQAEIPKQAFSGESEYHSSLGMEIIGRLVATGEITQHEASEMGGRTGGLEVGQSVPTAHAEKIYDAAVRATAIVADLMGMTPAELQATGWLPIQEAGPLMVRGRTSVWNDSILKILEGRSPLASSMITELGGLDSTLIDPNEMMADVIRSHSRNKADNTEGIFLVTTLNGVRAYADPALPGVTDMMRTARPIDARPVVMTARPSKDVAPEPSPTNPVRWIAREARRVRSLTAMQRLLAPDSPSGEFRTVSEPTTHDFPDVHSPGNYMVVEVSHERASEVADLLQAGEASLDVTQVPLSFDASTPTGAPLARAEVEYLMGTKEGNNPLLTHSWVTLPYDPSLGRAVKSLGYGYPVESYVQDVDGSSRRTYTVFGMTAEQAKTVAQDFGVQRMWTTEGEYDFANDLFFPVEQGVTVGGGTEGTQMGLVLNDSTLSTEFTVDYQADEAVPLSVGPTVESGARQGRRVQLIVEFGPNADPSATTSSWEAMEASDAVLSVAGYWHGELWAHPDSVRAGEYSYTDGDRRMTHRARHSDHQIIDPNYHTVWVSGAEALRMDPTHGRLPNTQITHDVVVSDRFGDSTVELDSSARMTTTPGLRLEVDPANILKSKVEGEQIGALSVVTNPETQMPVIIVGEDAAVLQGHPLWAGLSATGNHPAVWHVTGQGRINKVTNDSLPIPEGYEFVYDFSDRVKIPDIGTRPTDARRKARTKAERKKYKMANEAKATGVLPLASGDAVGIASTDIAAHIKHAATGYQHDPTQPFSRGLKETTQPEFSLADPVLYDPANMAEIGDVFRAIEVLRQFGVSPTQLATAIKGHPLGTAMDGQISPVPYALYLQMGKDPNIRYEAFEQHKKHMDRLFDDYHNGENSLAAYWLDALGEGYGGGGIYSSKWQQQKKGEDLDLARQEVYRAAAKELIPDLGIWPDDPIGIIAGYGSVPFGPQRDIVLQGLGALGALTERPGHQTTSDLRDLPGVARFREAHGGMMFPGVVRLLGSITFGAISPRTQMDKQSWAGQYHPPSWRRMVAKSPQTADSFVQDRIPDRYGPGSTPGMTAWPAHGIHISVGSMARQAGSQSAYDTMWRIRWGNYLARMQRGTAEMPLEQAGTTLTMFHEFGHASHGAAVQLDRGHLVREQLSRIISEHGGPAAVADQLSTYAATTWIEVISESFTLTFGTAEAPPLANDVVEMMWRMLYDMDYVHALEAESRRPKDPWAGSFGPSQRIPFWNRSLMTWDTSQQSDRATGYDQDVVDHGVSKGRYGYQVSLLDHLQLAVKKKKYLNTPLKSKISGLEND
ncbi:MAG: hypothetical protein CMA54_03180 [Euryarchaeota archaeon]|jgi:hypothetical protein|nr:hypothetical protein [Euryarchaeota archaeon]|tara:strand:- start:15273 stop:21002 length:5730 start_codon:yes stop_codon:yes gene_type:complete